MNWTDSQEENSRADTNIGKSTASDGKNQDMSQKAEDPGFQSIVDDGIWGSSFNDIEISNESSYGDISLHLDWTQDPELGAHSSFTSKQRPSWQGDKRRESNSYEDRKRTNMEKANSDDEMDMAWWDDDENSTKDNGHEDESSKDSRGLVEHLPSEWDEPSNSMETMAESSSDITEGVAIEVISGPFKDFDGVVTKLEEDSEKIQADIDVFGKQTTVKVRKEDIKVKN